MVTDPPYEFNTSGGGKMRKERKCLDDIINENLDKGFDHSIVNTMLYASSVVFCHNDQLPELLAYMRGSFTQMALLCAWHKNNPPPFANKHYLPDTEFYIHAWNKGGNPLGDLSHKNRYTISNNGKSGFDHPTVKPLELMEKIMRNVNGKSVIDPFMGTGTTGIAAIRQGKTFIGIEKNEKYFDIACARIRDEYAALNIKECRVMSELPILPLYTDAYIADTARDVGMCITSYSSLTDSNNGRSLVTDRNSDLRFAIRIFKASDTPLKRVFSCHFSYDGAYSASSDGRCLECGIATGYVPVTKICNSCVGSNPELKETYHGIHSRSTRPILEIGRYLQHLCRRSYRSKFSGRFQYGAGRKRAISPRFLHDRNITREIRSPQRNLWPRPRNVIQQQTNKAHACCPSLGRGLVLEGGVSE